MEQKVEPRKRIVKIVVWVFVIVGLLLTAHLLVNNFDALEVFRKLHGG
ncbi:MAG: hypothetical protein AB1649_07545 [Chloroflexota bacterium]